MAQRTRRVSNNADEFRNFQRETSLGIGEGFSAISSREGDEAKRVFPFLNTPSGNLKIVPNQVVFESKKVSVLVADPKHTKVNVKAELGKQQALLQEKNIPLQIVGYVQTDGEYEGNHYPSDIGDESHDRAETEPEFTLESLGSSTPTDIDWKKVSLPKKTDLCKVLMFRINNNVNPDVLVQISNDVFHCHMIVLQCYSAFFDSIKDEKHIHLPENKVSSKAFTVIYDWMITIEKDTFHILNMNNVLEVFLASQFLAIKELEEQCWGFISCDELFSEYSAFTLFLEAKKYQNNDIMDLMVPRIVKHFLKLVGTKNFTDLCVDELCILLSSNYVTAHSEIEVFMSAVRWLKTNWSSRKAHLVTVMQCVRFGLIAPWQLVDIQRNPENPEFLDITNYNDVQKMVEDGLAFAIIKYWYGDQTEDYYHWIDLLGLEEPAGRNWMGEEKNYVRFRDFLKDLELFRQPYTKEKMESMRDSIGSKGVQPPAQKIIQNPPPPTMAEYMARRERASNSERAFAH